MINPKVETILKEKGYEKLENVAQGGFAEIYKGIKNNEPVAIKVLKEKHRKESDQERFKKEVQVLQELNHENIVKILEYDVEENYYYAMEYLSGPSLKSIINKDELSFYEKLKLYEEILEAVSYMHEKGIVHRDINPNNIQLNKDGKPVIIDLGLIHTAMSNTTIGTLGTPGYIPPESYMHDKPYTMTGEVWTLGIVLYQLFFKKNPCIQDIYACDLNIDKQALAKLPADLKLLLEKALNEDPARRQTTAIKLKVKYKQCIESYKKRNAALLLKKARELKEKNVIESIKNYEKSWLWSGKERNIGIELEKAWANHYKGIQGKVKIFDEIAWEMYDKKYKYEILNERVASAPELRDRVRYKVCIGQEIFSTSEHKIPEGAERSKIRWAVGRKILAKVKGLGIIKRVNSQKQEPINKISVLPINWLICSVLIYFVVVSFFDYFNISWFKHSYYDKNTGLFVSGILVLAATSILAISRMKKFTLLEFPIYFSIWATSSFIVYVSFFQGLGYINHTWAFFCAAVLIATWGVIIARKVVAIARRRNFGTFELLVYWFICTWLIHISSVIFFNWLHTKDTGVLVGGMLMLISTLIFAIKRRKKYGLLELPIYWIICSLSIYIVIVNFFDGLNISWLADSSYDDETGLIVSGILVAISTVILIFLRRKKLGFLELPIYWAIFSLFIYIAGINLFTTWGLGELFYYYCEATINIGPSALGCLLTGFLILVSTVILYILRKKNFGTLELPIYWIIGSISLCMTMPILSSVLKIKFSGITYWDTGISIGIFLTFLGTIIISILRRKEFGLLELPIYWFICCSCCAVIFNQMRLLNMRTDDETSIFMGSLCICIGTGVIIFLRRKKFGTLELPIYCIIGFLSLFTSMYLLINTIILIMLGLASMLIFIIVWKEKNSNVSLFKKIKDILVKIEYDALNIILVENEKQSKNIETDDWLKVNPIILKRLKWLAGILTGVIFVISMYLYLDWKDYNQQNQEFQKNWDQAQAARREKNWTKALRYYNKASKYTLFVWNGTDKLISEAKSKRKEYQQLLAKAKKYENENNWAESLKYYNKAKEIGFGEAPSYLGSRIVIMRQKITEELLAKAEKYENKSNWAESLKYYSKAKEVGFKKVSAYLESKIVIMRKKVEKIWIYLMAKELKVPISEIEKISYKYNGNKYLDMSSKTWSIMSHNQQVKYAAVYQKAYAASVDKKVERIVNKSGVNFVMRFIPPGRFWMGSPEDEKYRDTHEKRHRVIISKSYYICKYEITQGQWKKLAGDAPWLLQEYTKNNSINAASYISWNDIHNKLLPKLGSEFDLPTEAQWEYACRSGTTSMFYWGNNEYEIDNYAWYENNSYNIGERYAHAVGEKKPNAWGLYDMSGNVLEWCKDKYTPDIYEDNIVDTEYIKGVFMVLRGGCWNLRARYCRSAFRIRYSPGWRCGDVGFRCVSPDS